MKIACGYVPPRQTVAAEAERLESVHGHIRSHQTATYVRCRQCLLRMSRSLLFSLVRSRFRPVLAMARSLCAPFAVCATVPTCYVCTMYVLCTPYIELPPRVRSTLLLPSRGQPAIIVSIRPRTTWLGVDGLESWTPLQVSTHPEAYLRKVGLPAFYVLCLFPPFALPCLYGLDVAFTVLFLRSLLHSFTTTTTTTALPKSVVFLAITQAGRR